MESKNQKLRERLTKAEDTFRDIKKVVNELDDNHSTIEEEELIDDVLNDIPEIDKNFEDHLNALDTIDNNIVGVSQTKSADDMKKVQNELSKAVDFIQKTEAFVQNLETDIVDMGALSKLVKRDKELFDIKKDIGRMPSEIDADILMFEE
jgi:DNA repair ATPase RecN